MHLTARLRVLFLVYCPFQLYSIVTAFEVDDFSENGPQNEDVLLTVSSDEPFEELRGKHLIIIPQTVVSVIINVIHISV